MGFQVNEDLETIQTFEATCQSWMIFSVQRYCAERWADIWVSSKLSKYAFYIDSRVESALPNPGPGDQVPSIDIDKDEWIPYVP